ncbi:hypothetical protein J4760_01860 [Salinicoccus sp. ID82-1]|uniref:DUF1659 domain-containing protein n=1 Tax=Salinicoccus cyprini TaxID=2493691 RepID=A0A558AYD3_9STAP|nr:MULTISPECIES: hypothetical protein [Salinicoccus]MCG1008792.1 hypothetical protein [Salinicoccus sp. ID82-1]TVT29271.1 hypothetical protein FO441_03015 [Salinicoccus cyprini]
MLKSTNAKFYFFEADESGKEKLRFRSVRNLDTTSTDEAINTLASIYQTLTNDVYPIVEKEQTYVIN